MNNLNSILIEGNLCRDPELRYTPSDGTSPGTAVCTLVVSSVRTCKTGGERHEEVSFIEATTVGKLATVCAEHLTKALLCGRTVICVAKVTARALVRAGLMNSAYRGRVVAAPVTVLRPEPAAPPVQPIPERTDLKWASPGGWMGTLPEAGE